LEEKVACFFTVEQLSKEENSRSSAYGALLLVSRFLIRFQSEKTRVDTLS
jgi:hypothetical protein